MLEWLGGPDGFEIVANSIAALFLALAGIVGVVIERRKSKGETPEDNRRVEVAGALIDGTDARAIVAAINENVTAVEANTRETSRLVEKLGDVLIELIRAQR